jgi:hypothetical protein
MMDIEKDAEVLALLDKWQKRVFGVAPNKTTYCDLEATRGIVSLHYEYDSITSTIYKKICLYSDGDPFAIGYYEEGSSYSSSAFRTNTESLLISRCVIGGMLDYLLSFVDRTDHFSKYLGILKRHPEAVASWLTLGGQNKVRNWLCQYVAQRYLEVYTQTKKESVC